MAFLTEMYCIKCHTKKQVTVGSGQCPSNICPECRNKEESEKRAIYLKGLEALTLEERIKKIEAWTYDYKPPTCSCSIRF